MNRYADVGKGTDKPTRAQPRRRRLCCRRKVSVKPAIETVHKIG